MNSRNSFQRSASALLLVASFVAPSVASAESLDLKANVRAPALSVEARASFCAEIGVRLTRMQTQVDEMRAKVEDRRDERQTKLEDQRANRDGRVAEEQRKADEHRTLLTTKLETQATTDAQKAAVAKFRLQVQTAINARRVAYQGANATFKKGIDQAVINRRTAEQNAVTAFRTSVQAAITKAKADCGGSIAASTIKTNFTAAIKAAQDTFQQNRKAIDRAGEQAKTLAKTRHEAQVKATSDFHASMEKARVELKAAFSVSKPTSTRE